MHCSSQQVIKDLWRNLVDQLLPTCLEYKISAAFTAHHLMMYIGIVFKYMWIYYNDKKRNQVTHFWSEWPKVMIMSILRTYFSNLKEIIGRKEFCVSTVSQSECQLLLSAWPQSPDVLCVNYIYFISLVVVVCYHFRKSTPNHKRKSIVFQNGNSSHPAFVLKSFP